MSVCPTDKLFQLSCHSYYSCELWLLGNPVVKGFLCCLQKSTVADISLTLWYKWLFSALLSNMLPVLTNTAKNLHTLIILVLLHRYALTNFVARHSKFYACYFLVLVGICHSAIIDMDGDWRILWMEMLHYTTSSSIAFIFELLPLLYGAECPSWFYAISDCKMYIVQSLLQSYDVT